MWCMLLKSSKSNLQVHVFGLLPLLLFLSCTPHQKVKNTPVNRHYNNYSVQVIKNVKQNVGTAGWQKVQKQSWDDSMETRVHDNKSVQLLMVSPTFISAIRWLHLAISSEYVSVRWICLTWNLLKYCEFV